MSAPTEQNNREAYEELSRRSKRQKRKILIVALCSVLALALLAGGVVLIDTLLDKTPSDYEDDYYFYPPYEGDIMQNTTYLGMNREISYCADATGMGVTYALNEEELAKLDPSVRFVCDYLQTVIAGDEEAYNAMFDVQYLAKNGGQAAFNPQMLHRMTVYLHSMQDLGDGRKTVTYRLDYMIYRNDGTFRRDVGSDAIRSQYLVLTCEADGRIKITDLATFRVDSYVGEDS